MAKKYNTEQEAIDDFNESYMKIAKTLQGLKTNFTDENIKKFKEASDEFLEKFCH